MTIIGKEITPKLLRKILGFSVLGLLAVGVLVYFGLIWREKAQFTQAEKEIDALYAQIVEKVGKPDQEKKEKICDRPNLKYKKGPLSCFIATSLLFENKDFNQSNEFMEKVSSLSSKPRRAVSVSSLKKSVFEAPVDNDDQIYSQDLTSKTGLDCNLSYVYPAREQEEFNLKSDSALEIGIDCGSSALSQYFPMKN